ncbi:uncharacterized protein METZ01_LOCUS235713 [marine metagenome]|uniref:Uncharacterized protein n=1 Tax=marine metagenome TaxID=408172 RepID=A0A382H6R2_9ZZZZ
MDFKFPENLEEINNHINSVWRNLPSLTITSDQNLLDETINITQEFAKNKKRFIVFGTGGSNLGARALINISPEKLDNKIYFHDNIDPIFFEKSLSNIDFTSTGFIIISKSGKTPETLSQLGAIVQLASNNNSLLTFYSNCLIITQFKASPLFNIAKNNNCLLLEHKEDIGGRYSIFSNVGMVPAIIAGLDAKEIHRGARRVIENDHKDNLFKLGQLFKFQKKISLTSSVIMTYSDALQYFGKWYLQLWAESIGKDKKGITAIHSIGTTDQHSQLQLYLDGPKDKFFTFITTNHSNKGFIINKDIMNEEKVDYLVNKKMGDLMQAEQQATLDTFGQNNIKFREIYIPIIDTYSIGSLMALSIIETVAACVYFEVNPFNQPAVEQGKRLTKQYLR